MLTETEHRRPRCPGDAETRGLPEGHRIGLHHLWHSWQTALILAPVAMSALGSATAARGDHYRVRPLAGAGGGGVSSSTGRAQMERSAAWRSRRRPRLK